jgi:hypothetical protein
MGALDALSGLPHMSFCSGQTKGEIFADSFGGDIRALIEVPLPDGLFEIQGIQGLHRDWCT